MKKEETERIVFGENVLDVSPFKYAERQGFTCVRHTLKTTQHTT